MRSIFALTCLFFVLHLSKSQQVSSSIGNEIVEAELVKPGEFPSLVFLYRPALHEGTGCLGIILNSTAIIAERRRCLSRIEKKVYKDPNAVPKALAGEVKAKRYDPDMKNGQLVDIDGFVECKNVYDYDYCQYRYRKNDIILLNLPENSLQFNDQVNAVSLPSKNEQPAEGVIVLVSDAERQVLRKVKVKVVPQEECKKRYANVTFDTDMVDMICTEVPTFFEGDMLRGPSYYDVGAPLFFENCDPSTKKCSYELLGILANWTCSKPFWTYQNYPECTPLLFAKTYKYIPWFQGGKFPPTPTHQVLEKFENGALVEAGETPFIVGIEKDQSTPSCTGTLTRSGLLMTSGKCNSDKIKYLYAGTAKLANASSGASLEEGTYQEKSYDQIGQIRKCGEDLEELITVSVNKNFSINQNVSRVNFASYDSDYEVKLATMAAFDFSVDDKNRKFYYLRKANVKIISNEECLKEFEQVHDLRTSEGEESELVPTLDDDVICAEVPEFPNGGLIGGDNTANYGAPLYVKQCYDLDSSDCRLVLLGVLTRVADCKGEGFSDCTPMVFAKTLKNKFWLRGLTDECK